MTDGSGADAGLDGKLPTAGDIKEQMERIYRGERGAVADIPWNHAEPPALLVMLVETGRIEPCRAIDLGCGAGNYAVYLAGRGFTMTGVDISPRAIELARARAEALGRQCTFIAADLLSIGDELPGKFDFAYDWEVLHHIFPADRERYVEAVCRLLNPGALYLSVCFSERDPQFGGEGKYRRTRLGTLLYFSSEDELRELFAPHFDVLTLDTMELAGDPGPHIVVKALLRRRG